MPSMLVYDTSDPEFADRAVKALIGAGVPSYRVGEGVEKLNASLRNWTDQRVFIYIERQEDYRRANEILVALGAVMDKPIRLPTRLTLTLLIVALIIAAALIAGVR